MSTEHNNRDTVESIVDRLVTEETSSSVKTVSQLWLLAREVRDTIGDPLWDELFQMGCNPRPAANMGYQFEYDRLTYMYFPPRGPEGVTRFTVPKLVAPDAYPHDILYGAINQANISIPECKLTVVDSQVWLVFERSHATPAALRPLLPGILNTLKAGVGLFREILENTDMKSCS